MSVARAYAAAALITLAGAAHAASYSRNFSEIAGGPYFSVGLDSAFVYNGYCYRVTTGPTGRVCQYTPSGSEVDSSTDCSVGFTCDTVLGDFQSVGAHGSYPVAGRFTEGSDCTLEGGSQARAATVVFMEDDTLADGEAVFVTIDDVDSKCDVTIEFYMPVGGFWKPTGAPTLSPTVAPSLSPTSSAPTSAPTLSPSLAPTTAAPTHAPTTAAPTHAPTTPEPTSSPSVAPSTSPTTAPTTQLLQEEYDSMPDGARPSSVSLTWEAICNAIGDSTDGCPASGKYEWCQHDGKYFDAPKADGNCSSSGLMVRDGRCYTCK